MRKWKPGDILLDQMNKSYRIIQIVKYHDNFDEYEYDQLYPEPNATQRYFRSNSGTGVSVFRLTNIARLLYV